MAVGFGVIGTGLWGEYHALTYSTYPGAELAAVCDVDAKRAAQVSERFGARRSYSDYRELLADPMVKAVTVATPDFLHTEVGVAAALAGKHILMEKPLALTVEDCQTVIDAAERAGVRLMVDFHNRWSPPLNTLKQRLSAGELGEPLLVNARQNNTIFVPTEMLRWAGRSATIWFTGSHLIDVVCWLVNSPVRRVYSVSRSRVLAARGIPTPDFFETTLEFANGAVAFVENCWILPNTEPSVVDFKLRLVGTQGSATVDTTHNRTLELYTDRVAFPDVLGLPTVFGTPRGFAVESIKHFAECIIRDTEPMISGQEGLANTAIICAALRSAESGQPVDL
ncbi:MAG: gfo/Idh/MocA family oxidoreductase [Chloroflexi bacterium]|nr:MAG: gfo/Idh/MocA family oxidoreductase [Chloroflexota bacterium]